MNSKRQKYTPTSGFLRLTPDASYEVAYSIQKYLDWAMGNHENEPTYYEEKLVKAWMHNLGERLKVLGGKRRRAGKPVGDDATKCKENSGQRVGGRATGRDPGDSSQSA